MDRACMECGKTLVGRSDKKFCDDQCRTAYHNRIYREDHDFIRNVQSILRKNRRILAEHHAGDHTKVPVRELALSGYNFDFFTNTWTTSSGETFYFCFDFGFSRPDPDTCLLIRQVAGDDDE